MNHASVTIDVDSIRHYRAIHGLAERRDEEDPIYTIAMPRFWELLDQVDIPATLFLIGEDAPAYASAFEPLLKYGSEVANHSYAHDYRLSLRNRNTIAEDLRKADEVLRPLNANRPLRGFRAPGYNVNTAILECVDELGYIYDSSVLPSPLYFGARWSIITFYRLLGRQSGSISGNFRQFITKLHPYKMMPDRPFQSSRHGRLIELPIACTPWGRMPLIGTSLALLPHAVQDACLEWTIRKLSFFNFEMHAIDLLDASDHPAIAQLSAHQRDVQIPVVEKMARHKRLFWRLKDRAEILALSQVAEEKGGFSTR